VQLKDEGKIRHIGLSNVSVDQLERAQKLTPIVSVQNRYSLMDRTSESVLLACSLEGVAFIPWNPLEVGELNRAGGLLAQIAQRYGATPGRLPCLAAAHSPVMLPIPGTSKVAHLEENIGAVALELAPAELAELDRCPRVLTTERGRMTAISTMRWTRP